jgi:uncharacterized integral membrane protein (TIGR00698 family)
MNSRSAPALPAPTPRRDKLNGVLFVALLSAVVVQVADLPIIRHFGFSPLVVGIVCGMLYGNFLRGAMPVDWSAGVNFTARRLLRIAVAFYGLNISIQQIAAVGLPGLAVSVGIVVTTLLFGTIVGHRLLGLDRDTALLTSAGSAICGAAAVLAFEPTLRSAPHKSAVAVATVVLFGTLSMFLYPALYHAGWLPLSLQQLGIYIGGTVHEVAQVVGAASNVDPATTDVATIVKMTRVALLVPVLIMLGLWLRSSAKHRTHHSHGKSAQMPVPWFAVGFLLLAIFNSLSVIPPDAVTVIRKLDVFVLTMAMTALGIETRFSQIRAAGPRVMVLGLVLYLWLLVAGYGMVVLAS